MSDSDSDDGGGLLPPIHRAAMAGDLEALNADTAKKQGFRLRDDVQNMLRIVKERRLAGLRAAVGAKEFLPSLASIGLASAVYRQAQRSDS